VGLSPRRRIPPAARERSRAGRAPSKTGEGARDARRLRGMGTMTELDEDDAGLGTELGSDLALRVETRAFPLSDVLGWLNGARKSGLLHFARGERCICLHLCSGEVVFARSNRSIDRLGRSLVRAGVLSLEQLREAERAFDGSARFGKVLVERGFLTPRQLWDGLQGQVEEIVHSLFCEPDGVARFFEGHGAPDNVVRSNLSTQQLVREGLASRDRLRRWVARLRDPRLRLEPVAARREWVSGEERALLDALAARPAFATACERLGLDAPTAARMVQFLHRSGAIRIRRGSDDPERTQRLRSSASSESAGAPIGKGAEPAAERAEPLADGVPPDAAASRRARLRA
jgi:Domain of unknown function (DUF4388)